MASFFLISEAYGTPVLIGIVYFILNILSAFTAQNAYRVVKKTKQADKALFILLITESLLLLISSFGFYVQLYLITVCAYIFLSMITNIWGPINIAQYDNYSDSSDQASILSIASQAKTLAITILAPICGFFADTAGIYSALLILFLISIFNALYAMKKKKVQSMI